MPGIDCFSYCYFLLLGKHKKERASLGISRKNLVHICKEYALYIPTNLIHP